MRMRVTLNDRKHPHGMHALSVVWRAEAHKMRRGPSKEGRLEGLATVELRTKKRVLSPWSRQLLTARSIMPRGQTVYGAEVVVKGGRKRCRAAEMKVSACRVGHWVMSLRLFPVAMALVAAASPSKSFPAGCKAAACGGESSLCTGEASVSGRER